MRLEADMADCAWGGAAMLLKVEVWAVENIVIDMEIDDWLPFESSS